MTLTSKNLLYGNQIRLTAVDESDAAALAGWHENTIYTRLADATPATPRTKQSAEKWIKEANDSKNGFMFAIRPLKSDDIIGFIELDGILWTHGTSWLGIGIGEAHNRGKGYGSEALTLTLRFAFHELNLHRIQLTVFEYNEKAIALYEKLGFSYEGTFREFLNRDGRRYDMLLYGILRSEWEANYPA